jgi:DNA polymerase-1
MTPGNKFILIDGHSLAYRAFHALPQDMMTSRGELTNAVFGFASMLLTVWREEQPDYIAVAFDVGRTFRHEEYDLYKANRQETPEEMIGQMERIHELVDVFQLPSFSVDGYEADDVLGTLARQAVKKGLDVVIVTGDRDALQLVDDHVKVLTSGRRFSDTIIYDPAAVESRYDLAPHQLIDLKALMGDKSDNIPGVRGIGEKTATKLLKEHGTLDGVYEHLDEITNKRTQHALREGRDDAFLSQYLGRIVVDVPIELDVEQCRAAEFDRRGVVTLFTEMEFRSLASRLPASGTASADAAQMSLFVDAPSTVSQEPGAMGEYQAITTSAGLSDLVARLSGAQAFAFDTETTSIDSMQAELVGIALACEPGEGYYIPVGHETGEIQLSLSEVKAALGPLLADPDLDKYAHHAKYDMEVLERVGIKVQGLAFDTMIAEWVLNPASHNLGLKNLALVRLGVEMTPISELIGTGKAEISMATISVERVVPYAAADADMTLRLAREMSPELNDKQLWGLFADVEMPLVRVLMQMEMTGIALDTEVLSGLSTTLQDRLFALEREIQEQAGQPFNISSTGQLSDVLFVALGLPKQGLRKTKSGRYSTAADVLEGLRDAHPIVGQVLEYRQLSKLRSTYVDTLPRLVNPQTGRLHTSFNQTGTSTGRLSSSDPNLQNIPIRTELGRQIRRAFVARPDWRLLAVDYSQIELRVLAHVSGDEAMLAAFARGEDIHSSTAAAIYGVSLDEVTSDMRRVAKTTNFAIAYGVTGFGLSRQTDLTPEEAQQFIAQYFERFPGVKAYLEGTKKKAAEDGYVETLLGRRRYFPELAPERNIRRTVREAIERVAINAPIQGSAADIIKIAMNELYDRLEQRGLQSRILLQIHDELILEAPPAELDELLPLVRDTMEGAMTLRVPLQVDMKVGKNWLDMKGTL